MNYDRIILELLERVSILEEEVKNLKYGGGVSANCFNGVPGIHFENSGGRDVTKYVLDGKRYGKNRLVLAVIKKYVDMNPGITAQELLRAFDKSLQGSLGVVRILADVQESCSDYTKRFFVAPDEIIHTSSEDCVVCNQWTAANIEAFLVCAEQMGINILRTR